MLPSSVRRVVAAAPQSPALLSISSSLAPLPSARAAVLGLTRPGSSSDPRGQHQRRRYSSSKPSNPSDSPKDVPNGQMTTAPAQSSKAGGQKKRKAKDSSGGGGGASSGSSLPCVPSTHHLPREDVALCQFFGQHRPISVTRGFPQIVSNDAFAQIFAPPRARNKYTDVLSTLEQTVTDLEQPMQSLSMSSAEADAAEAAEATAELLEQQQVQRIEIQLPSSSEASTAAQLNAMSGEFSPHRPPPPPQAQTAAAASASLAKLMESSAEASESQRVYKAMITVVETRDRNGGVHVMAHSPSLVEEREEAAEAESYYKPRTFLERMAIRQIRRRPSEMVAISVRRQRKLKMKKKKYKKLMKRTRNERRKLDRI